MGARSARPRGTAPTARLMMQRLRVTLAAAALLAVALAPVRAAKTIDFDALTIADINHAFDCRRADLRKAGAAVSGAHRGLRSSGAVAARRADAEPEGARHGARARRRAQGQRAALAAARHPDRPQGQLQHRRSADRPAARCCSKDRFRPRMRSSSRSSAPPARSSSPR